MSNFMSRVRMSGYEHGHEGRGGRGHVRRVIRGRVVAICIVDLQRVVKGA